jgi:Xaa-Pro aminopeptidase
MRDPDSERAAAIRDALTKAQYDGLVLFHPDNILMATGMLPGSTHVAVVVSADGRIVVITPWWRETFAREESWADEILTFDWCRDLNDVDPLAAMLALLKRCQAELRLEKVGFDGQMHHYSPNKLPSEFFDYAEVKSRLCDIFASASDSTDMINELKSLKTRLEISSLRKSNRVARAGVRAFYQFAVPGIKESDLAAEVNYAVLKMVGEEGIRYTYCDPPQITSGPERTLIADTMSNHATDRVLQVGEPVMLEIGLHADGYWADITRCVVVGEPTGLQERLADAILSAQKAAIDIYVPGTTTGEELCEAAWEAMRTSGFSGGITHALGHGVGFAYHEDRPSLCLGDRRPVRPNQVTSLEPGLYWRDGRKPIAGLRIEDNVVWGSLKGQAEILSDFYRGLDRCIGLKSF